MIPVVGAVTVIVDQLTKWWALETLPGNTIELVGPLQLRLTFNTGGAFGLGAGFAPVLAVAAFVLVIALGVYGRVGRRPAPAVALGLVLGGAVGNLVDRVFREGDGFLGGAVVDFIDLQFWPVFNVADMGIVVGGFLLVLTARDEPGDAGPDPHDPAPPDHEGTAHGSSLAPPAGG